MDDLILEINEAEKNASQIKSNAYEKASEISAAAASRAAEIERTTEQENRQYAEKLLLNARQEAEENYNKAVAAARAEAQAFADDILKDTGSPVIKIVGRICGGNS